MPGPAILDPCQIAGSAASIVSTERSERRAPPERLAEHAQPPLAEASGRGSVPPSGSLGRRRERGSVAPVPDPVLLLHGVAHSAAADDGVVVLDCVGHDSSPKAFGPLAVTR